MTEPKTAIEVESQRTSTETGIPPPVEARYPIGDPARLPALMWKNGVRSFPGMAIVGESAAALTMGERTLCFFCGDRYGTHICALIDPAGQARGDPLLAWLSDCPHVHWDGHPGCNECFSLGYDEAGRVQAACPPCVGLTDMFCFLDTRKSANKRRKRLVLCMPDPC